MSKEQDWSSVIHERPKTPEIKIKQQDLIKQVNELVPLLAHSLTQRLAENGLGGKVKVQAVMGETWGIGVSKNNPRPDLPNVIVYPRDILVLDKNLLNAHLHHEIANLNYSLSAQLPSLKTWSQEQGINYNLLAPLVEVVQEAAVNYSAMQNSFTDDPAAVFRPLYQEVIKTKQIAADIGQGTAYKQALDLTLLYGLQKIEVAAAADFQQALKNVDPKVREKFSRQTQGVIDQALKTTVGSMKVKLIRDHLFPQFKDLVSEQDQASLPPPVPIEQTPPPVERQTQTEEAKTPLPPAQPDNQDAQPSAKQTQNSPESPPGDTNNNPDGDEPAQQNDEALSQELSDQLQTIIDELEKKYPSQENQPQDTLETPTEATDKHQDQQPQPATTNDAQGDQEQTTPKSSQAPENSEAKSASQERDKQSASKGKQDNDPNPQVQKENPPNLAEQGQTGNEPGQNSPSESGDEGQESNGQKPGETGNEPGQVGENGQAEAGKQTTPGEQESESTGESGSEGQEGTEPGQGDKSGQAQADKQATPGEQESKSTGESGSEGQESQELGQTKGKPGQKGEGNQAAQEAEGGGEGGASETQKGWREQVEKIKESLKDLQNQLQQGANPQQIKQTVEKLLQQLPQPDSQQNQQTNPPDQGQETQAAQNQSPASKKNSPEGSANTQSDNHSQGESGASNDGPSEPEGESKQNQPANNQENSPKQPSQKYQPGGVNQTRELSELFSSESANLNQELENLKQQLGSAFSNDTPITRLPEFDLIDDELANNLTEAIENLEAIKATQQKKLETFYQELSGLSGETLRQYIEICENMKNFINDLIEFFTTKFKLDRDYAVAANQRRGARLQKGWAKKIIGHKNDYPVIEPQIFEKKFLPKNPQFVWSLIIDNSGSCKGKIIQEEIKTAIALIEVAKKLKIPFEILTFGSAKQYQFLKTYDQEIYGDELANLVRLQADQGTPDVITLKAACESISNYANRFNRSYNFVYFMTDGESGDSNREDSIRTVLEKWQREAVITGIGLAEAAATIHHNWGKNALAVRDIKDLSPKFIAKIEDQIEATFA